MYHLIFGDIHIGKNHIKYKKNPYNNLDIYTRNIWWEYTKKHIIETIYKVKKYLKEQKYKGKICIEFLGDIYDEPIMIPEKGNEFKFILETIEKELKVDSINILVGNHDTTEDGSESSSLLRMLKNKNINVYYDYTIIEKEDYSLIFLPYRKPELLLDSIEKYNSNKRYYIFSHNDIFITNNFGNMDLIPLSNVLERIGKIDKFKMCFNGHIHNNFISHQDKYYQIGSISPTRFGEDEYQKYGIVLLNIENNEIINFPNEYIYFYKIKDINDLGTYGKYIDDVCNTYPNNSFIALSYMRKFKDYIEDLLKSYPKEIVYIKTEKEKKTDNNLNNNIKKDNIKEENKISKDIKPNNNILDIFSKYIKDNYLFSLDEINFNEGKTRND